jgi:hypothetical protein
MELARRWRVPETTALGFLFDFRDAGLAVESRGLWYATRHAQARYGWLTGCGTDGKR